MADYYSYPLWNNSVGEVGNINPDSLPISNELKERLNNWADKYDSILNQDDPLQSGFKTKEDEELFIQQGYELAQNLQVELGSEYKIIYSIDMDKNSDYEIVKPGCWTVGKIQEEFYIEFLSGELAGRAITFYISQDDFYKAIDDKISLSDLKAKYQISG